MPGRASGSWCRTRQVPSEPARQQFHVVAVHALAIHEYPAFVIYLSVFRKLFWYYLHSCEREGSPIFCGSSPVKEMVISFFPACLKMSEGSISVLGPLTAVDRAATIATAEVVKLAILPAVDVAAVEVVATASDPVLLLTAAI